MFFLPKKSWTLSLVRKNTIEKKSNKKKSRNKKRKQNKQSFTERKINRGDSKMVSHKKE